MDVKNNILETIGNTPIVRINKIFSKEGVQILAKLEGFNPMGSVKDRIAYWMVKRLEEDGFLSKEKTLVESSSGNTGIGLGMVAAVKGYRVLITMSKNASVERRYLMKAFGVEVMLVDGGSDEAWDMADKIAASDTAKYYRIHQYKSKYNALAHYENTGPEIWNQTDGKIDYLVVTLGTTGTIVGAGRFLKEKNRDIRIIAAEPVPKNKQQGLRNLKVQRVPNIWDESIVDETISVPDDPAFELARELASKEGIFTGISSGSCLYAAIEIARKINHGNIVAVLPDRGDRYLSTELWK